MCFVSVNFPERKIADSDIVCYKLVPRNPIKYKKKYWLFGPKTVTSVESLIMHYVYNVNVAQPTIKCEVCFNMYGSSYIIEKGYHSYSSLQVRELDNPSPYLTIVKCIIPKGTIYYGPCGDTYVSESIIVTPEIINNNTFKKYKLIRIDTFTSKEEKVIPYENNLSLNEANKLLHYYYRFYAVDGWNAELEKGTCFLEYRYANINYADGSKIIFKIIEQ